MNVSNLNTSSLCIGFLCIFYVLHLVLLIRWSVRLQSQLTAALTWVRSKSITPIRTDKQTAPLLIRPVIVSLVSFRSNDYRIADSAAFLSDADILNTWLHYKYLLAVPNQLLGIGIVGTFLALRMSLGDVSGLKQVTLSISIGLISSVCGLVASLTFGSMTSIIAARLRCRLSNLNSGLDSCYLLHTTESLQVLGNEEMPTVIANSIEASLDIIERRLTGSLAKFEEAWAESVKAALNQCVGQFQSDTTAANKIFSDALRTQTELLVTEVKSRIGGMRDSFSAAVEESIRQVRAKSVIAFDGAFASARNDLQEALRASASLATNQIDASTAAATAAAGNARASSEAIRASFEEIHGKIAVTRQEIDIGVGRALAAYQEKMKLVVEHAAHERIFADGWHKEACEAELKALGVWTDQLKALSENVVTALRTALTNAINVVVRDGLQDTTGNTRDGYSDQKRRVDGSLGKK